MSECEAFPSVFRDCSVFGIAHQPCSLRLHTLACPASAPSSTCHLAAPCGLCVPSGTFLPQDALPADGSWDARPSVGRTRVGLLPQLGGVPSPRHCPCSGSCGWAGGGGLLSSQVHSRAGTMLPIGRQHCRPCRLTGQGRLVFCRYPLAPAWASSAVL